MICHSAGENLKVGGGWREDGGEGDREERRGREERKGGEEGRRGREGRKGGEEGRGGREGGRGRGEN